MTDAIGIINNLLQCCPCAPDRSFFDDDAITLVWHKKDVYYIELSINNQAVIDYYLEVGETKKTEAEIELYRFVFPVDLPEENPLYIESKGEIGYRGKSYIA